MSDLGLDSLTDLIWVDEFGRIAVDSRVYEMRRRLKWDHEHLLSLIEDNTHFERGEDVKFIDWPTVFNCYLRDKGDERDDLARYLANQG